MADIFNSKEAVFFVGGNPNQTGTNVAAGVTKAAWGDINNPTLSLSDVMGASGAIRGGHWSPE
ncbi:unnamed protein product, partial [marine sediment metagenome]